MAEKTLELDLYFDESGNFNSSNPKEDYSYNQIAGIFFPTGDRTSLDVEAKNLLRQCYHQAYPNNTIPANFHGVDFKKINQQYYQFIQTILQAIKQKQWHPIRLVNQEEICYGHPQDNYLNMIAELILKFYQLLQKEGIKSLSLNVYPAYRAQISEHYLRKIQNAIGIYRVREELTEFNLTIKQILPISANKYFIIQLCDLLSNASYHNYKKCDEITKNQLIEALGHHNYTLIVPLFCERCENLVLEGSYALALRLIILELQANKNQGKALEYCQSVLDKLANLAASERNAQLSYLISWLEQTINQERLLQQGVMLGEKLLAHIDVGLRERLKNNYKSVIWFRYAVNSWLLRAYNHLGKINLARAKVKVLNALKPDLVQHLEYISLLMEGLVGSAVHYTDCFEYDLVEKELDFIETFYDLTVAKCINILVGTQLKSLLRAKALGTWLQALIYQYQQTNDQSILEEARNKSDRAINEFVAIEEKKRQYQYRCQLETVAKNFNQAREYLAKSLNAPSSEHYGIVETILQLDKKPQGFALLHWLRLGSSTFWSDEQEWANFQEALEWSQLLTHNPWCQGDENFTEYPVHGILRQVVSVSLKTKQEDEADRALDKLTNLKPVDKSIILGLVELAAYTEYIAITREKIPLCSELIEKLQEKSLGFPKINQLVNTWAEELKANNQENLLQLAFKIGY